MAGTAQPVMASVTSNRMCYISADPTRDGPTV
jgi:hypothetical protein